MFTRRLFSTNIGRLFSTNKPTILLPPKEPEPHECCGDDCPNCVWVTYFEELEKYKKNNGELKQLIWNKQIFKNCLICFHDCHVDWSYK